MEHTKRYMVIFESWSNKTFHQDINEFDTDNEWRDFVKLIETVYEDTVDVIDRYGDVKQWGYVVLDFKKEKILQWCKTGKLATCNKNMNILKLKDTFFRGENEIPKDYKWDIGEYEGWLRFRWGDGKNAVSNDYELKTVSKKELKKRRIDPYQYIM